MTRLAARLILRAASFLVPRRLRDDWSREWTAELWYADRPLAFACGAIPDAALLRLRHPLPPPRDWIALDSPGRCLAFLSISTAASLAFLIHSPDGMATVRQQPPAAHLTVLLVAMVMLGLMGMVRLEGAMHWKSAAFLAAKLICVAVLAAVGALDFAVLLSRGPIQTHVTLLGYILGFRWAFQDQVRRCPVCLRRLEHPVRMGAPSSVFLDWYGTEYVCPKGHGLMHVPEIPAASYRARNWLALDPSWRSLFR